MAVHNRVTVKRQTQKELNEMNQTNHENDAQWSAPDVQWQGDTYSSGPRSGKTPKPMYGKGT